MSRAADLTRFALWDARHTLRGLVPNRTWRRAFLLTVLLGALFLAFVFSVAIVTSRAYENPRLAGGAPGFLLAVAFLSGVLTLRLLADHLDGREDRLTLMSLAPLPSGAALLLAVCGVLAVAFVPVALFVLPLAVVLTVFEPLVGLRLALTGALAFLTAALADV
ncbi:hypothetical protein, partial [Deinococcus pimensis]|uniref:hypothetical protein n=1 Tax=Deinococcus pimensis TaxID=309888 RepID=UPI00047FF8CE